MAAVTEDLVADPGMLVLLRESRGMTQAEVATAMAAKSADGPAVSQGYVSRAEKGLLAVSGARLGLFAQALGYPAQLLCLDPQVSGIGVGLVHHRKKASLSATALRCIHAQLVLTRMQLAGMAAAGGESPGERCRVPRIAVDALTSPKDAARLVRKQWGIAPGPVADVTGEIEAAGGLLVVRDLGSALLDAVSQWAEGYVPLLLVNSRAPGDRCRFSVAHELGHLVMHATPGTGIEQEKQADMFAAEFLMPATDIRAAFSASPVDLARLAELKRQWQVSMAALLRRAQQLNVLTEWQYRTLTIEMSALGYRTTEPVEVPREHPRRVAELVERLLRDRGLDEAAAASHLLPEDFQHLYVEDLSLLS